MDNLKAPLVANLDITQFNKQLQGYITEQIKQGVEQAKKEIRGEMVELVDTFEDAHVKDNLTAELKDELKNLKQNLLGSNEDVQHLKHFQVSMKLQLDSAVQRMSANEQKVGFTACVRKGSESNISADKPIPFTLIRTSYNVDMSSVTRNGTFIVKTSGFYLISASIRSNTDNGFFGIYDNSNVMVYGNTAEHQGTEYFHTGTVDVVKYIAYDNMITVRPWKTMFIGEWSCLTVVKIK